MSGTDSAPFISDQPMGSFAEDYRAAPPSQIGSETDWLQGARQVLRAGARESVEYGQVGDIPGPTEESSQPDVLNQKYSIPGKLNFDSPLPDSVAKSMYDTKRDELMRQDATMRRPPGFVAGAETYGLQFVADALDPVNIAAVMIPGVPELDLGASLAGRLAARGIAGAASGAVGMAPLAGIKYGLGRQEQSDYDAYSAISDIAMGAGLGAVLHVGGGALGDWLTSRVRQSPQFAAMEDPETRAAALKTAMAQMAEDRPVEVRPVFDAAEPEIGEPPGYVTEPPPHEPVAETPGATPFAAEPREPTRLTTFLQNAGGLRDDGGDVSGIIGGVRGRPGLIRANGMSLDEAAHLAWENGYFPESATQRPDINQLLDALDDDVKGLQPRYSAEHDVAVANYERARFQNSDILRLASETGISPERRTTQQFYDAVAQHMTEADLDKRMGGLAVEYEASFAEAERLAREHVGAQGEAWHAADFYGKDQTRTLEDLENEYRQEAASPSALERPGGGEPGGPAAGDQTAVPTGGEPGQRLAGAPGRAGQEATARSQVLGDALRAAAGERGATPVDAAADAAAKLKPDATVKLAAEQTADHEEFFRQAEAAGALTDEVRAELEGIHKLDQEAADVGKAAMQAAGCMARGLSGGLA